jgi:uncharacterized protein YggU (UPF0235/DUF167 family)
MHKREFKITDAKGGAAFTVRVVSRARQLEIAGVQDDGALKIRLTSSKAGSEEANNELLDFLAEQLGVEKAKIEMIAGEDGREKLLSVEGIKPDVVESLLSPPEE